MKKLKTVALRHFETTLIAIILFGIIAIAFLVQYKFAFLNFFFLPVILAGYYLGKRQAVLAASLCVLLIALYQIFFRALLGRLPPFTLDDTLNLVTWAGFLIITGAIIGRIAEQRQAKLESLQRAYTGVLEIMLKYLEVADETRPRSVRLSHLAGKIARSVGLATFHVENIKSAALLLEAGNLKSNLSLYDQVAGFMEAEGGAAGRPMDDKERVLLKTTASLLKEVEPLLINYFRYYIEEAQVLDKNLDSIPIGSSIIALADIFDRLSTGFPVPQWKDEIQSLEDIRKLSGRAFPAAAVEALLKVASGVV
ncbi:MAG: hypothetical protein AB1715_12555 [Acidobacteriota bacterium]